MALTQISASFKPASLASGTWCSNRAQVQVRELSPEEGGREGGREAGWVFDVM